MRYIQLRLSPALIVAVFALIAALGGSALAAGEIITDPSEVKQGVLDGRHIKQESISNLDLKDAHLRVRHHREPLTRPPESRARPAGRAPSGERGRRL